MNPGPAELETDMLPSEPTRRVNGKFYNTRPVRAPKARWEDAVQRDTRDEETGNTQGRMETSSEGGQGPEGAVAPWKKKKKKM